MFKAVLAHLDSKPAGWNTLPALAELVEQFRAFTNAMIQLGLTQSERNTMGYTLDKDAQLEDMCELTYQLLLKIRPYARKTKNNVLLQAVDYAPTSLRTGAESEIITRCQLIHNQATTHLAGLAAYMVTEAELNAVQAAIDTFKPLSGARDAISGERTTATANIPVMMNQAKETLASIDDLVEALVKDSPFVETYQQVRQVIDRGGSGGKPEPTK